MAGAEVPCQGRWFACTTCAALVVAENLQALLERCLARADQLVGGGSPYAAFARERVQNLLTAFIASEPGPPQPIATDAATAGPRGDNPC